MAETPKVETIEALLDYHVERTNEGWRDNPARKEILERFATLEARQITPEMQAIWDEYQAAIPATGLKDIKRTLHRESQSRLWLAFITMMAKPDTPDAP